MDLNLKQIESLRDAEVARIADSDIRDALRSTLVALRRCDLQWEHGAQVEHYPAVIVAEFPERRMAIAFSERGFGPDYPWGLISLERLRTEMDANWFHSLEDAYRASGASLGRTPPGYEVP